MLRPLKRDWPVMVVPDGVRPKHPGPWQHFVYVRGKSPFDPQQLWLARLETATLSARVRQAQDLAELRSVEGNAGSATDERFLWASLSPDGGHVASMTIQEGVIGDPFLDFNFAIHRMSDGEERLITNEHSLGGLGKAAIRSELFDTYMAIRRAELTAAGADMAELAAFEAESDFWLDVDHIEHAPALRWIGSDICAVEYWLPVMDADSGTWLGNELFSMRWSGLAGTGRLRRSGVEGRTVAGGIPPSGPAPELVLATLPLLPGRLATAARRISVDGRSVRFRVKPGGSARVQPMLTRHALLAAGRIRAPA